MKTIIALAAAAGLIVPATANDDQAIIEAVVAAQVLTWKCPKWTPSGGWGLHRLYKATGVPLEINQSMVEAAYAKVQSELKELDQFAACRLAEQQFGPEGSVLRGLLRKEP